jgi:hypothetical protein
LAAYIDGILGKAESKQIAEHLATCEDCYAVYIGAVRFKLDSEPAPADNVAQFPSRKQPRNWLWPSLAAAATILVATVLGGGYYLAGPLPALLTAQVTQPIQGKSGVTGNLWRGPTARGAGDEGKEVRSGLASFQMGVQLVNLQVSLGANQGEQAQDVVARILQILQGQLFVDELTKGYKDITLSIANGTPPERLAGRVSELAGQARDAFETSHLDLGQWVEAGRLAAIASDPAFFQQRKNRIFLRHVLWRDKLGFKDSKLPEASRGDFYRIGQLVLDQSQLQPADYPKLQDLFESILKADYPE